MKSKGFTLIEIIIVIAISAMLATIAIGYNAAERNQIALSVETAKVSQFILTAKGLALATYNVAPGTCGFGVYFDITNDRYSLFAYHPSAPPPCPSAASTTASGIMQDEIQEYSIGTWQVPVTNGVLLKSGGAGTNLSVVLFYPPAPTTLLSTSTASTYLFGATTPAVHLVTEDNNESTTIFVSPGGQVNY